jgi:hypothetical protein
MGANPFPGVFPHRLGGLAPGSFYASCKGVKKWSWETDQRLARASKAAQNFTPTPRQIRHHANALRWAAK